MTIGEKFKKLRLERKLTQNQLCGEFVTRNMLSRIEHDAALPSLETLKYLAGKLDIDPGYFVSDGDDPTPFIKLRLLPVIKSALESGDFELCLSYASRFEHPDPELCLVFYEACMSIGRSELLCGRYVQAAKRFEDASGFAEKSYNPETLRDAALYFLDLCRNSPPTKVFEHSAPRGDGRITEIYERSVYELLIRLFDGKKQECAAQVFDTAKLSRSIYRKHINARLSIASGNYSRARDLLREIEEDKDGELDLSFGFRVCSDLERCCKALGDYEGAYRCAVRKSEILSRAEEVRDAL